MAAVEHYDQATVDRICQAIAWATANEETFGRLTRMAVEETGMGSAEGVPARRWKILGILRDALRTKSVGIIEEIPEKGIVKYAKPVGVIAGVLPVTNPLVTMVNMAINAVKCRDAVIFSPHPLSKNTALEITRILRALTAQLAAVHMRDWPAVMRADALLLVGTSDRLDRIAFESALTAVLGLPDALCAKGWTAEALRGFGALTNPEGVPAIAPESIFVVLGTADDVTPFDGGVALAERWRVPPVNQFRRPQGHFSLSPGLIPDNAPLLRFAEHLRRL